VRAYEKVLDLAYGENPHQRAAYYSQAGARTDLLSMVSKLHGKELSLNNLLDLDSGRKLLEEFEVPAAAIIKHNNPCGAAVGSSSLDAYERALASDPMSAYGGVYCFNRRVDRALAERLNDTFVELVFGEGYDEDALEILMQKPNIRILDNQERRRVPLGEHDIRRVRGGILVQDRDSETETRDEMSIVTERRPTEEQWGELLFAWRVCKHVRSNAIVLGRGLGTVGIGAGQMSRVDAVRIAIEKANASLEGAVMASDAFFPFPDGPELAIEAGISAIIQPGGSQRDDEVVQACDEADVAMVFTARRHFRH
jgi:phosphoribosylaminoimidazolecarboxamide formyltransferase / IMP cyclohydrolase